ncbi:MAG: riboflavin biosynthesis protein RibF [Muribaculaceae bacterium]|nr:riboflavin biosynthesis protein RibF [Muribaculaceae bacterium]
MKEKDQIPRGASIAAIGTFDGVHRGHHAVLDLLSSLSKEKGLTPLAFTFRNHPLQLIDARRVPASLTPLWKKKKLIEERGVKPVVLDFDDELRSTTAKEWMIRMRDSYGVVALIVGYDNTFGSDGVNHSLEDFIAIGEKLGIEVFPVEVVTGVSSSAIRKAVKGGDMEKAGMMLGRPYSITAKVVKGNSLGHTIGFPTANIETPDGQAEPLPGVYAAIVKTLHDGKKHPAMVNVGTRPTVMRGDNLVIEAHIINWQGDLYGKDITVRFIKRLRDEKKFDSIEALKAQLTEDREFAMDALKGRL